jgi:hypothetical protein
MPLSFRSDDKLPVAQLRGPSFAVDHPGNSELVDQHAELLGEERRPDRHRDDAALGERAKRAFGLRGIIGLEGDAEALRLGKVLARRIAAHEAATADREPRVHDPLGLSWHALDLRRRVGVAHEGHDLALQRLGVEGEGGLALAVETEIGNEVDRHRWAPFLEDLKSSST